MLNNTNGKPIEQRVTAVFHMASAEYEHTFIFNGMGDTVDYIDVDGVRFEPVRECEMFTAGTPCDGNTDLACSECGSYNIAEYYDGLSHRTVAKYCPDCGAFVSVYHR